MNYLRFKNLKDLRQIQPYLRYNRIKNTKLLDNTNFRIKISQIIVFYNKLKLNN